MKLSIVIPAYNEEAYLGKCLEAVMAECHRTTQEVEIIVVNNASTDGTDKVARSFPSVTLINDPKKGLVQARDSGYRASTGDLIANIDADTIMPEGWIDQVIKTFSKNERVVALSGPYIYYDLSLFTNWGILLFYRLGSIINLTGTFFTGRSGSMLQGGNFILRRSALERAGGFNLQFDFYGEDTAIAKRMSTVGQVIFSFQLPMYTSGRRLQQEGILRMAVTYGVNFLWPLFFNRPYTKEYKDIRL